MKKYLMITVLCSTLALTGCKKKPSEEQLARQQIYQTNIENTPKWTEEQNRLIQESRGVVIAEEKGENEEVIEVKNSFSPGDSTVDKLASMTKEELLELDADAHLEIFINGVIRDEYSVAAHTLYGAEEVKQFKEDFKKGLLSAVPEEEESRQTNALKETTYVDRIGLKTAMQDGNVASKHVDAVIQQMNRIFVQTRVGSNFGNRVIVEGQVYPIKLPEQLEALNEAAFEFTGVNPDKYRYRMNEGELKKLNKYYVETFGSALVEAEISEEGYNQAEIGGFEQREDGTWVPAQMSQFSWNLVRLIYGIN